MSECSVMHNPNRSVDILTAVRALGVGVAISEFGTGYSSMSTLHRVAADKIKIDRSVVRGVHEDGNNAAICRSIISLAPWQGPGSDCRRRGAERRTCLVARQRLRWRAGLPVCPAGTVRGHAQGAGLAASMNLRSLGAPIPYGLALSLVLLSILLFALWRDHQGKLVAAERRVEAMALGSDRLLNMQMRNLERALEGIALDSRQLSTQAPADAQRTLYAVE